MALPLFSAACHVASMAGRLIVILPLGSEAVRRSGGFSDHLHPSAHIRWSGEPASVRHVRCFSWCSGAEGDGGTSFLVFSAPIASIAPLAYNSTYSVTRSVYGCTQFVCLFLPTFLLMNDVIRHSIIGLATDFSITLLSSYRVVCGLAYL